MIVTTSTQGVTICAEVTAADQAFLIYRTRQRADEYEVNFLSVVTDVDGWDYVNAGKFDYEAFAIDTEITYSELHAAAIEAAHGYECEPPTVDALQFLNHFSI
jgi:hypothetical protein